MIDAHMRIELVFLEFNRCVFIEIILIFIYFNAGRQLNGGRHRMAIQQNGGKDWQGS